MHDPGAHAAAPLEDVSAIGAAPLPTPTQGAAHGLESVCGTPGAAQRLIYSAEQGSDAARFFSDDLERSQPRRTRSDSDLAKVVLSPAAVYAGRVQLERIRGATAQSSRCLSDEEKAAAARPKLQSAASDEAALPVLPFRYGDAPQFRASQASNADIEGSTREKAISRGVGCGRSLDIADEEAIHVRRRRRSTSVEFKAGSEFTADEPLDPPYPEVRASVPSDDEADALVLTLRVWIIGLVFCAVISAVNAYWSMRYPSPVITPSVTQILAYPLGLAAAKWLPNWTCPLPRWTQRLGTPPKLSTNPGPFSRKELTLLTMMANASTAAPFAYGYSIVAEVGYHQRPSLAFDVLLVLSSQTIGFGIAGLTRRFLVWPASMIWPQNLVYCAVLGLVTKSSITTTVRSSQTCFFATVMAAAFCWYWVPGFLFTALSAFSWVCWIAPTNVVVNQLFGVASGLGMGIFTFDWSQISSVAAPLVTPWWAQVNAFGGFVLLFWILAPVLNYTNTWNTAFLPMSANAIFDRFGRPYNTSRILSDDNFHLNATAYSDYSPVYLPATFSLTYAAYFVIATALLVHTSLYHGPELWRRLRHPYTVSDDDDVHIRLMRTYEEVPDWWYALLFAGSASLALIAVRIFDTGTPLWAVLLALAFALVYFLPCGIVNALSSYSCPVNALIELIAGYLLPGNPRANMLMKVYSLQTMYQGLYYSQNLKLAHYQKVPPRATFSVQVVATATTSLVQVGVKRWLMANRAGPCSGGSAAGVSCGLFMTWFSTATFWGLIGPSRLFSPGKLYHPMLLYGTVAGVILPAISFLLAKRRPGTWVSLINVPLALTLSTFVPPATGINFSAAIVAGFIFQYYLRIRHTRWWARHNYLLSAGLDTGTAICGIVMFLALELPKGGRISLDWWGNTVYMKTADWLGTPYKTPPPEGFGPTSWS